MRPPLGIVLGAGFGLVIGTLVAAEMAVFGFASRYYRERALSRTAVFALIPSLAGVHALLIGALSPDVGLLPVDQLWAVTTRQPVTAVSENIPFLGMFTTVTTLLGIYGHGQGGRVAADVPASDDSPSPKRPILSPETVATAGEDGFVSIDVTCEWSPAAGTPSPSAACETIESREWMLPADLPLGELETRLAARITTVVGVDVQDISIDDRGRGIVTVGPPADTVATRLPDGKRAVTVRALVPAGLEADDHVTLVSDGPAVDGRVLAVSADSRSARQTSAKCSGPAEPARPTAEECPVTVAVDAQAASTVLTANTVTLLVRSENGNQPRGAFGQLERCGMAPVRVRLGERTRRLLSDHAEDIEIVAAGRPEASGEDSTSWSFHPVGACSRPESPMDSASLPTERGYITDYDDHRHPAIGTAEWIETLPHGTELFVIGPDHLVKRFTENGSRPGTGGA